MKVDILTSFLHEGVSYEKDETRVVDDETGNYFCRAGWAKDLSGAVATATPNVNDVVLKVENTNRKNTVENANG